MMAENNTNVLSYGSVSPKRALAILIHFVGLKLRPWQVCAAFLRF